MVEFSLSSLMLMWFCELRNNVVLLSLYGTLEWFLLPAKNFAKSGLFWRKQIKTQEPWLFQRTEISDKFLNLHEAFGHIKICFRVFILCHFYPTMQLIIILTIFLNCDWCIGYFIFH